MGQVVVNLRSKIGMSLLFRTKERKGGRIRTPLLPQSRVPWPHRLPFPRVQIHLHTPGPRTQPWPKAKPRMLVQLASAGVQPQEMWLRAGQHHRTTLKKWISTLPRPLGPGASLRRCLGHPHLPAKPTLSLKMLPRGSHCLSPKGILSLRKKHRGPGSTWMSQPLG